MAKLAFWLALVLAAGLLAAPPAGALTVPALAEVTGIVPPGQRAGLRKERAALDKAWRVLSNQVRDHNGQCRRVRAGSPKDSWCEGNLARLSQAAKSHIARVRDFNRRVGQAEWAALNRRGMSPAEEQRLGRELARLVEKRNRLLSDPATGRYLAGLLKRLAKGPARPGVRYQARVIDKGSVNAFVLPGGRVYLHRALLAFARDESELAGVLAHEMAHVKARHHQGEIGKTLKSLAAAVAGGALSGPLTGFGLLTQRYFQNLAYLKYTRDQEREADRLAVEMLYTAGFNPAGLVSFLDRLAKTAKPRGWYGDFLSTHPKARERARNLAPLLADPRFKKSAGRQSKTFAKVRARLRSGPWKP